MSTRAVLFDLDDTLYPERQFALSGFAAVAGVVHVQSGRPVQELFVMLRHALKSGARQTAFQQLCQEIGWPDTRVRELVQVMRGHSPRLRLPASSRAAIAALRPDWRLGIVTNGMPAVQERKIRSLGLARLVDVVVYAEQYGRGGGKPDPEPFLTAALKLDVDPSRCVFVGNDPVRDIAGARAVGMQTIRFGRDAAPADLPAAPVTAPTVVDRHAPDTTVTTLDLREVPRLALELLEESFSSCR